MFDASGNVRIPERIVVYYKGIGEARGTVQVFPEGMALVATEDLHQFVHHCPIVSTFNNIFGVFIDVHRIWAVRKALNIRLVAPINGLH